MSSDCYLLVPELSFHTKFGGAYWPSGQSSDSGSGGQSSILGRVGVLYPRARDVYPPKVLVIPRNRWLRLNMTEKLFTGTLNKNQNKKKTNHTKFGSNQHSSF